MAAFPYLISATDGAARTEQHLDRDEELLAAYRDHFGIVLDRVPRAVTRP